MSDLKALQEELSQFRARNKATLDANSRNFRASTAAVDDKPKRQSSRTGWFNQLRRRMFRIDMEDRHPLIEDDRFSRSDIQSDQESEIPDDIRIRYCSSDDESIHGEEPVNPWTSTDYYILAVKILIYLVGQAIAFMVQFGAVFFSISLLYFIYATLGNRRRRKGELSAYSVFNPGCKRIDGTVSAEQLQTQLTFGAL